MVTGISEFAFFNSGIRIVENPSVEPNVSIRRFFAQTAIHCGSAWRNFDAGYTSTFPFCSGRLFSPFLKRKWNLSVEGQKKKPAVAERWKEMRRN